MAKTLNFYRNYNGKLWLDYFTTIRSIETVKEKDLKEGDFVDIQKNRTPWGSAQIVRIEKINLDNLSESQKTILMLDYGCNWFQAADSIANICNGKDVALITLVKTK